MYQNCSCVVDSPTRHTNATPSGVNTLTDPRDVSPAAEPRVSNNTTTNTVNVSVPLQGARQGLCLSDCKLLYVVAPLLFLGMLLTFTTVSPTQTATLRWVCRSFLIKTHLS